MKCPYVDTECSGPGADSRWWICPVHGARLTQAWTGLCRSKENYHRLWNEKRGPGQNSEQRAITRRGHGGPGTELTKIIAWWQKRCPRMQLSKVRGCGCKAMARWMDKLGPDGCEQNIEKIVDKLQAEAIKRKMKIPFQRFLATRMVKQAIRRARKYEANNNTPASQSIPPDQKNK